jgi:chemotaxis protein CheD
VTAATPAWHGTTRPLADAGVETVYLHSGKLHVSATPCRVSTILGSCVAVAVFDPVTGVGGLNHFLLPHGPSVAPAQAARFGNLAVPQLVEAVLAAGAHRASLQAKLFGGACVLAAFKKPGGHLGTRNVEVAREMLKVDGIPVVAEDVEGGSGRKLIFQTHDGVAWVRSL